MEESEEFRFYRALFPHPKFIQPLAGISYEQAQKLFPERFNIQKLQEIFTSWLEAAKSHLPQKKDLVDFPKLPSVIYRYDRISYKADMWVSSFVDGNNTLLQ
jgi:hypothetical protein